MVNFKLLFVWILISVFLQGCFSEKYPVDTTNFSYHRKGNFKNQFRIDGLFYNNGSDGFTSIIYLFQDGISYSSGTYYFKYQNIECYPIESFKQNVPFYWGAYIIDKNILKIQEVHNHRDIFVKFGMEERWAKIVNDTTIHFFKRIFPDGDVRTLDETYHFRKCTNKPDSTNILMKY